MNGSLLLDTNAVIALVGGDVSLAAKVAVAQVFVPIIVLGELYFGAEKSVRAVENTRRLDEYVTSSVVLGLDLFVAKEYGKLKNELRIKGRPIPANDTWIAAIARHYDLILMTRDAHFSYVDRLKIDSW